MLLKTRIFDIQRNRTTFSLENFYNKIIHFSFIGDSDKIHKKIPLK